MRMRGVDPMQQRLDMVLAPERYGLTVTEAAAMWGVSRQTWHVWRRRYDTDGVSGLADRGSAPRSSPGRVSGRVEVEVMRLREAHPRWGPRRVRTELLRRGLPAPARSTIQRILVRHGVLPVRPTPAPPPQRFERATPNELWQTDATDWVLADGAEVAIISVLDDHSRYCAAATASASATRDDAIAAFDRAAAQRVVGPGHDLHRPHHRLRRRVRTTPVGARRRHRQRPRLPSADPGQDRALPPHPVRVAHRRRTVPRPGGAERRARPVPCRLQHGPPAPSDRRRDPGRAVRRNTPGRT